MEAKRTKTERWRPEPGSILSKIFGVLVPWDRNLSD